MDLELFTSLRGSRLKAWKALLQQAGLSSDFDWEQTVLIWDGETLAAAGSRSENILKGIAVGHGYQGSGLTAMVLTALRQEAFRAGMDHLFLYTKPENRAHFSSLFFYPVVQTREVLLMESKKDGIRHFLDPLPVTPCSGQIGSIVMNCDPFTLGHLHLVQTAAEECEHVYVFVLSEDKGLFSTRQRMEMAKLATARFSNVTVLPTGPYLISRATFPTYFLKDRDTCENAHCLLDISVFLQYFVPHFQITHRYVGEEPFSSLTAKYNDALKQLLPPSGLAVHEIPRFSADGEMVSASHVRKLYQQGLIPKIKSLVPESTLSYITDAITEVCI